MSRPATTTGRTQHSNQGRNRPIFVVACARSGTTLLQLMLHAHPRIAVPPETRFLVDMYQERASFGDLTQEENRRKLADFVVRRPVSRFKILQLRRRPVVDRIVEGPPTIGSAAAAVYQAYAEHHGKARWGDKRPAYILYLDMVLELFPDAQIVHIIRDGRDCVGSLKGMRWWGGGTIGAIWYWRQAMRVGARARATLPADQYHELYYESLVADPEPELRRLCDFLGEEFSDAMLEPHRVADVGVPAGKLQRHHSRTRQAVDSGAVARWKERLEPGELHLMELVARRELQAHGYTRATRFPLPPPALVAEFLRYVAYRRVRDAVRARRAARLKRTYTQPVASQLEMSN